jgi:predicted O-methyltransferase YrrM
MMWYRVKSFFYFYFRAISKYNVQSPFLYDFVTNVLDTNKKYYAFDKIENERHRLKHTSATIAFKDFGSGSSVLKGHNLKIAAIAKTALSDPGKCRILFQLVNHYNCAHILELGTSLGISSAYLASANHKASIITMEGDENIARTAAEVHNILGIKNTVIVTGSFKNNISNVLSNIPQIDLAFIDGHHEKSATLYYFEQIIKKCNPQSILVFDDIYWSEGMTQAWQEIIKHDLVTLSIDLFDIGIVFLKKDLSKQQVSYLPYKYKPWQIGLFG